MGHKDITKNNLINTKVYIPRARVGYEMVDRNTCFIKNIQDIIELFSPSIDPTSLAQYCSLLRFTQVRVISGLQKKFPNFKEPNKSHHRVFLSNDLVNSPPD